MGIGSLGRRFPMMRAELTQKILSQKTAAEAELEDDCRRDRRRFAALSDGGADGSDETASGAGGARRAAARLERGGEAPIAGGAVSRLVADRGADRSADLPLLRAGAGLWHELEGADPGGV